jgi:hypothetical protein
MTMKEIHEKLVEDEKLRCEEAQRLLLMQLSGLGAVAWIQAEVWDRERGGGREGGAGGGGGGGGSAERGKGKGKKKATMASAAAEEGGGGGGEGGGGGGESTPTNSSSSSSSSSSNVTAVLLGKDRFLAESARYYEKALLIAEGNRQPVSLGGAGSLTGAPRFRCKGGREGGREGGGKQQQRVVSFWWEMEGGGEGGMVVDVEEEAAAPVGNGKGKASSSSSSSSWVASEQSPLWASVTFEGGNKKVMGMRFWPLEEEEEEKEGGREGRRVRMPGKCRVMACSSPEGAVFVEVGVFDLRKLVPEGGREGGEEGGRGCRTITGFNMFAAKTWKLEVLSVMDEEEGGREGGVVRVGARVEFLAAEIEVDPLQILHVTTNLREVFQAMQGEREGGREGGGGSGGGPASALMSPPSSPAPGAGAAAAGEEEEEEEEGATSSSSSSTAIVMRYEDVRSLPLPQKLAWLEARTRAVTRRECNLAKLLHRANRQYYLSASQAVEELQKEVREVRREGGRGSVTWWEWTLGQLARSGQMLDPKEDLLRRLKMSPNKASFPVFQGFHGLMMALKTRVDDLEETRKKLNMLLRKVLTDTPSEEEMKRNSVCGVCKKDWGKTGPVCGICELDKHMTAYEGKLYTYRKQGNSQIDGLTAARAEAAGTEVVILPGGKKLEMWKGTVSLNAYQDPCEAHRLLYTLLLPWLRKEANRRRDEDPMWAQVLAEGTAESKRKDLLERERKTARRFWNSGYDLLSKLDEVACSAIRLELAEEGEDARHLSVDRRKVVVFPAEVGVRREEMGGEVAAYEAELRERKKQLQYLKNIAQVETRAAAAAAAARNARIREEGAAAAASKGSSSSGGPQEEEEEEEENVQECPVCFESLVEKPVMVLPCAHHLCEGCLKGLMGQRAQNNCPKCRRKFHKKDVARAEGREGREGGEKGEDEDKVVVEEGAKADEEEDEEEEEEGPEVEGSWGTKVTALVREVLRLPAEEKCLIFSEWDEMLDLVQEALSKNGVGFVRLKGERAAGKARREFREEEEVRCMLLNLKSGAKGLTLVEANHVFLLEPVFNAATEAQAVNRVYRIGQSKPTFIHRFVVKGTIEEKVERMRQAKMMAAGGESGVLSTVKKQGKTRRDEMELGVEEMEALFATAPAAATAARVAVAAAGAAAAVGGGGSSSAAAAAGAGGGGGGGKRNGKSQRVLNMAQPGNGGLGGREGGGGGGAGGGGGGAAAGGAAGGGGGGVGVMPRPAAEEDMDYVNLCSEDEEEEEGKEETGREGGVVVLDDGADEMEEEEELPGGGRRLGGGTGGKGGGASRSVLLRRE